ncbi:MAG: hypothetical protein LH473_04440 [Chitinophagales bacterium]|nr:hypothetical protein [Chitinophagales bacterium]
MKTFWIIKGIKFTMLAAIAITAFTYVVMMLWNWLMPAIFEVTAITFIQALGILVLSKIIFGFGHGGGGHWGKRSHYMKGKMEERLKHMSPEEREKFRSEWKQRCGGWKHDDWVSVKKEDIEKSSA